LSRSPSQYSEAETLKTTGETATPTKFAKIKTPKKKLGSSKKGGQRKTPKKIENASDGQWK
jgi:hypothetical protein